MEDEIDLTAKDFLGTSEDILEVVDIGRVSRDKLGASGFAEVDDLAHSAGGRGVGEGENGTLLLGLLSDFPSYGFFVEGTEDDAALAFQKILYHCISSVSEVL